MDFIRVQIMFNLQKYISFPEIKHHKFAIKMQKDW